MTLRIAHRARLTRPAGRASAERANASEAGPRPYQNIWGKVTIGKNTKIGAYVEIGDGVVIGDDCKIEAFAFIPPGVVIGNRVFIGPHVCFTNDKHPPSPNRETTLVEDDASIGANATILSGIRIGRGAVIGAGSVVTKPVYYKSKVYGNPAREHRWLETPSE